ncbi:hypothetical protein [Coleofasciculus sp. FACHB-501]|uniref:hypothetical protein n=1 Tax=Cyanophyceae TaxID=3028117 RepID=UPI0016870887|nr:hypothetical protein [Coleofasciculus sp. FACHB-501]MBD1836932.1 hypothetical protein [Coleofasciculus sp. FACHB-501]
MNGVPHEKLIFVEPSVVQENPQPKVATYTANARAIAFIFLTILHIVDTPSLAMAA